MDLREFARQEALRQGVDPSNIMPLIGTESSWNNGAVSPKGAAGLMQLMPGTARGLGLSDADRFDPQRAIPAGIRYYKQQLDRFGSPALALAAYNAGPGAVARAGGIPNIPETQNYVRKIAMGEKTALSVSDAAALLQAKTPSATSAKAPLSVSDAAALLAPAAAAPTRIPLKIIDKAVPDSDPLSGYNVLQRALIGAGKAGSDLVKGIGLGDVAGLTDSNEKADAALLRNKAALGGYMLGQTGIMYSGGKLLQGAGTVLDVSAQAASAAGAPMQQVAKAASMLQKGGGAIVNPSSYGQAAAVGGGFGLISQPGSIDQRLINAAAGAAGGTAGLAIGRGISTAAGGIKRSASDLKAAITGDMTAAQSIEHAVTTQLSAQGVDFSALPRAVQQQLLNAGRRSFDLSGIDANQLRRIADFERLGIQPTRGWVTRDPVDWWTENNLNTVDPHIAARYRDANQALLEGVRDGASQATDYNLGNRVQNTLSNYDAALKANVDRLYSAARDAAGRDIPLDAHRFVNNASTELDQQMLGSKLPADTLQWFQRATSGHEPFDMGTALQRLQALNGRIYSTTDMAEAKALGIVKKHLTDAIDGYGGAGAGSMPRVGADPQQQLSSLFRQARTAAADRFRFQESNPLVEQVLSGRFTPEKLPAMLSSMRVDDLTGLAAIEQARGIPVMATLRDAARAYIRDASTLQAETGGSFTVAGLRRALDKIGPEKGQVLFGVDGWQQYQRILNAAGSIHNAPIKPAGSSTAPNLLRLLSKTPIPGAPWLINATTTAVSKANQMANVGRALNPALQVVPPQTQAATASRLPLLSIPGLLTTADAQH